VFDTVDFESGEPRVARRSPLRPTAKLCPRCLEPLQKGSKFGGWLVPQDYFCESCGYEGTVFLEESSGRPAGEEKP
jgi:transposase-like protein